MLGSEEAGKTWLALEVARQLPDERIAYITTEATGSLADRMRLLGDNNFGHVEIIGGIPSPPQIKLLANIPYTIVIVDVLTHLLDDENSAADFHVFDRNFAPLKQGRR